MLSIWVLCHVKPVWWIEFEKKVRKQKHALKTLLIWTVKSPEQSRCTKRQYKYFSSYRFLSYELQTYTSQIRQLTLDFHTRLRLHPFSRFITITEKYPVCLRLWSTLAARLFQTKITMNRRNLSYNGTSSTSTISRLFTKFTWWNRLWDQTSEDESPAAPASVRISVNVAVC